MKAKMQVNMKYLLISFLITAFIINLAGVLIAQNTSNTQPTRNITNSPQESQKLPLSWIEILKLLSKGLPLWLVIIICFVIIILIWILKEPIKNIKDEKIKPSLVRFYTWILVHLGAYNRLINNYRRMLNGKLKESGLTRQLIGEGVNLDNNYIPIQLSKEEYRHPETEYPNDYQEITGTRLSREDMGRVEVEEVLADDKKYENKIVIIGDPGAGKTTLLCHIAYELTKGKKMTQIPVLITFSSYVKSQTGSLILYMEKIFEDNGFPKAKDYIDRQIRTGNLLILMDGFDEVELEKRSDLREQIQNLALNPEYDKNKFLVTSRPIRDAIFNNFKHLEVMPLEPEQRKVFLESKIDKKSPDSTFNAKKCAELIDSIENHDRIRKLAENPLLLTFLYHVYKYNLELPRRRVELYRQSINLMLDWDIKTNRPTHIKVQDRDAKKEVLKKVAYYYHTNKIREVQRDDLIKRVNEYLPDSLKGKFTAEELIQDIENSSGILRHKSAESYEFIHLTFQEYLTAEYINDNREKETPELIKKLGDSWWREVSLLLAGIMGNATSFISQIIGYCQTTTDETKSLPCILIAFACIYEAEVDKDVQNDVFNAFVELPYKQTVEIIERMFGLITENNKDIETFLSNILGHSNSSVQKWGLNFVINMQIYKESWDLANRLLKADMDVYDAFVELSYERTVKIIKRFFGQIAEDNKDIEMFLSNIFEQSNISVQKWGLHFVINNIQIYKESWDLANRLLKAGMKNKLKELLLDIRYIKVKLNSTDVYRLTRDYDLLSDDIDLKMVKGALQLSANALNNDKSQIEAQMIGRLMLFKSDAIQMMLKQAVQNKLGPWLHPMKPDLIPPDGHLVGILKGHSSRVTSVAITPDGYKAVSASDDNTLKVRDIDTGDEIRTLKGHSYSVNSVAITPDGRKVVSASDDTTLKVWDIDKGDEIRTLKGHSSFVNSVAITPDGHKAVSVSSDKTLKVWDIDKGDEIRTLKGHNSRVYSIAITPDGHKAVSASRDTTLKVWDIDTGDEIRTLKGHSDWRSVVITPDGRKVVSASYDNTLKVWDIETGDIIASFDADASMLACAVAVDGVTIVAGDASGVVHFMRLEGVK